MDRYVIVCLIKGEALKFHEKLVEDICFNFKIKRQKLPAHFTIKAPFETDSINIIEDILDKFIKYHCKSNITIDGFDYFRTDVVFMKVLPSKESILVHDKFIDELKKVPYLTWKRHESSGFHKIFHCTIVSRIKEDKFDPIWEYVNKYNPKFQCYFDNISILKWNGFRWITYKEYKLK